MFRGCETESFIGLNITYKLYLKGECYRGLPYSIKKIELQKLLQMH